MGADISLQRNTIHVLTELPVYYPGDEVRGTIYLNVVTPFNSLGLELQVCLIFDI